MVNDPRLIERAEILREKGTNRSRFFRGQVDKYTWVDVGSSFLPSDILAAVLLAQLEARNSIQSGRKATWEFYNENLADWAMDNGVHLPYVPDYCEQSYHMFYMLAPSLEARTRFITHLKENGILAVFHYLPLHRSPMGLAHGGANSDCPVTDDISDRLVRLPFYNGMTAGERQRVAEAILEIKF